MATLVYSLRGFNLHLYGQDLGVHELLKVEIKWCLQAPAHTKSFVPIRSPIFEVNKFSGLDI